MDKRSAGACAMCGATFEDWTYRARRYCSKACAVAASAESRRRPLLEHIRSRLVEEDHERIPGLGRCRAKEVSVNGAVAGRLASNEPASKRGRELRSRDGQGVPRSG